MTNEEIKACQEAYAARPFAVRWADSHVSLTNRFHTFEEAFAYAQQMWTMIRKEVRETPNMESHLWWSNLQTPDGRAMPLAYFLLTNDVSSYRR